MADHNDTPGEPPTIRDEAADSPMWLPALGLTLLILGTLLIAWRSSNTDEVVEDEAAQVEEAPAEPAAEEDDAPAPE